MSMKVDTLFYGGLAIALGIVGVIGVNQLKGLTGGNLFGDNPLSSLFGSGEKTVYYWQGTPYESVGAWQAAVDKEKESIEYRSAENSIAYQSIQESRAQLKESRLNISETTAELKARAALEASYYDPSYPEHAAMLETTKIYERELAEAEAATEALGISGGTNPAWEVYYKEWEEAQEAYNKYASARVAYQNLFMVQN